MFWYSTDAPAISINMRGGGVRVATTPKGVKALPPTAGVKRLPNWDQRFCLKPQLLCACLSFLGRVMSRVFFQRRSKIQGS